jgi:hypothetical protein
LSGRSIWVDRQDAIRPGSPLPVVEALPVQVERDQIGAEINDRAIFPLFEVGLSLQAIAARLSPSDFGEKIGRCVEELDRVIFELRDCVYRST